LQICNYVSNETIDINDKYDKNQRAFKT